MSKQNDLFQSIVNKRICAIIAHGNSIYELQRRMQEFKNLDICWVGIGQFDTIEKYIMEPAGKSLDIVFDCGSVPDARSKKYELNQRIPRLEYYLGKNDRKLWITTFGAVRDGIKRFSIDEFWSKYENQTLMIDSLFPRDQVPKYMCVPNSLTLCVGAMIGAKAKKIILFGCDGYKGTPTDGINSYYRPDEVKKERLAALGSIEDKGINRDTNAFEGLFKDRYIRFADYFQYYPAVFNCSPNSVFECIPKINYDQAKLIMQGQEVKVQDNEKGWKILW